MRAGAGLAWIGAALVLGGAQERPSATPPQSGQVVVTAPDDSGIDTSGPAPTLRGGVWRFERSATLVSGQPVNRAVQRIPSVGSTGGRHFAFATCLPDDSLEGALQRLAGDRSPLPNPTVHCGRLRMKAAAGEISGRRSCQLVSQAIGRSHSTLSLRLSGRYDKRDMKMNINGEEQTDGLADSRSVPRPATYRWQVKAHRIGDCAGAKETLRSLDEAADLLFIPEVDGSGI